MSKSAKLKIVHVYKDFVIYNALFGTMLTLAKNASKESYELQLCVLNYQDNLWGRQFESHGGRIVNLGLDSAGSLKAVRALTDYLRIEKPDIVQTHELKMNILGRIAACRAGVPIIIGTVWTLRDTAFSVSRRLRDRLLAPIHKYLDRKSQAVVVISNAIRKEWDPGRRDARYRVIYIPYDLDRLGTAGKDGRGAELLQALRRRGCFLIGLVSRLSEEKGIQYLLRALPRVISEERKVMVCIAGEGKYRSSLENLSRKLNISKNVQFFGHLNDVSSFLRGIDLFVQPSRSESLGVAIMEAMVHGVAVIATDVGGIPEIVEDGVTGLLVRTRDPRQLAEKILYLIRNPKVRETLGEYGRRSIRERFSVEEYIRETSRLYEELTQAREARNVDAQPTL